MLVMKKVTLQFLTMECFNKEGHSYTHLRNFIPEREPQQIHLWNTHLQSGIGQCSRVFFSFSAIICWLYMSIIPFKSWHRLALSFCQVSYISWIIFFFITLIVAHTTNAFTYYCNNNSWHRPNERQTFLYKYTSFCTSLDSSLSFWLAPHFISTTIILGVQVDNHWKRFPYFLIKIKLIKIIV